MSEKIKVVPTKEQIEAANQVAPIQPNFIQPSAAEKAAAEEMLRRTEEQLRLREEKLAERARLAAKTVVQEEIKARVEPVINHIDSSHNQSNAPYDLIPLPSEGLLYPHKKSRIKVAFLNASDENILTAPHLLESGEFLDILLSRKVIEEGMNPKDLHVGDRNAIMVWLRATAYGPLYPVELYNYNTGKVIQHDVDLRELKTKKLGAIPDRNGLFDFTFPVSGAQCKFRLLTVGDVEDIDKQKEFELETLKKPYAETLTYTLEKQIVEVNGDRSVENIRNFINVLRIGDSRAFRKYVDEIESGLDMNITIEVPGGEPFTAFLPININFFWPEL